MHPCSSGYEGGFKLRWPEGLAGSNPAGCIDRIFLKRILKLKYSFYIIMSEKVTLKEQEDKIRQLLQDHIHKVIPKDSSIFPDFLKIMEKQEQWRSKLNNIQSFRITRSRLNKALSLQVRVNNFARWLTVSWRKGTTKKRKEENPLQSAFRQSIRGQIRQWKRINNINPKCVICNDTHHSHLKLQADHVEPFSKLTEDFVKENIPPTEFDYHYRVGKKFRKEDNKFKIKWQNYHKKKAVLQWLCRKCNLKKK